MIHFIKKKGVLLYICYYFLSHIYLKLYCQVFNTTSRIGIYCGTTLPKPHRSPLQQLIIHFYSDGSIDGAGFNLTFIEDYGKT